MFDRENVRFFFRAVYGKNEGYACVAFIANIRSKKDKEFRERFFHWPDEELELLDEIESNYSQHDVYYCPHLFSQKNRTKDNVIVTPSAWSDLDLCDPDHVLVEPTITIESSPKRYQALWLFDKEVSPIDAEDLSRRIAYYHQEQGADRSGWDLTQLLRVPTTNNFKHVGANGPAEVKMIGGIKRLAYRLSDFEDYPAVTSHERVSEDIPQGLDDKPIGAAMELLESKRLKVHPSTLDAFADVPEPDDNWSNILWRMLMSLFETGFTKEEVYLIAREAGCNKFARDRRAPSYLWHEVCRAHNRHKLHEKITIPQPEDFEELMSDEELARVDASDDTFVDKYIKWASGLGDAAPQYHQAGAFTILSALLCGAVKLPTSFGTIYPNLWFLITADTTLTRKSTAMDIATDLLNDVNDHAIMATDGSLEGLLTQLTQRAGMPSLFLRDEFSGLLEAMTKKDYMAGMPELLTKLYDGKMQKRVLRRETMDVRDPRLIIFAGGIRSKILSLMSFDMVASGFMPRFIFITAESDVTRLQPLGPPVEKDMTGRDAMVEELSDLQKFYKRTETITIEKLNTTIEQPAVNEARLTPESWQRYNKLEFTMLENAQKSSRAEVTMPMSDRLAKSILKSAVLIAASRQREAVVTVEELDLLRAIKYGQQWWAHASTLVDGIGKSQIERHLDVIYNAIKRGSDAGVSRSHLMQSYHLTAKDANAAFETLEQRGMIHRTRAGSAEVLIAS